MDIMSTQWGTPGIAANEGDICPACRHAATGERVARYLLRRAARSGTAKPEQQCMAVLHEYGFGDADYCACTVKHTIAR